MRMNNVEMNDEMLEQVNGGLIRCTYDAEEEAYKFSIYADDGSGKLLNCFWSSKDILNAYEVYKKAEEYAKVRKINSDLYFSIYDTKALQVAMYVSAKS